MTEPQSERVKITHSSTSSPKSNTMSNDIRHDNRSVFDLIDALPAELIHKIFFDVFDLSPQKIGSRWVIFRLYRTGEFPFSPSTKREYPLWRERSYSQKLRLRDGEALDEETPDRGVACIALEHLLEIQHRDVIEFRNINVPDLIRPLQQTRWLSVQLNGLLAFMDRSVARESDDPTILLGQLDNSIFNTTYRNRGLQENQPTTLRHRLLDQPLHFRGVQQVVRFFESDPSRIYQTQAMSVHYTDSVFQSIDLALGPILSRPESDSKLYFIAHIIGAAGNGTESAPYIGELHIDRNGLTCLRLCFTPLFIVSFGLAHSATLTQLKAVVDHWLDQITAPHSNRRIIWPPTHFEWNAASQRRWRDYFDKLYSSSGCYNISLIPGVHVNSWRM